MPSCTYATSYDSLLALHSKYGQPEIAQTLTRLTDNHVIVRHNIDATQLNVGLDGQTFDLVVFNFPKVGATSLEEYRIAGRVPRNRYLIASFLVAAAKVLTPHGSVVVAQKSGHPYRCWTCTSATHWASQVRRRALLRSGNSTAALVAEARLTYQSCSPFIQSIFKEYRSANVSPAGSGRRRKFGFGTVALDGKPTAFMHVFTLDRGIRNVPTLVRDERKETSTEVGGATCCEVCHCIYTSVKEGRAHLNSKRHKLNTVNDTQWNQYLEYLDSKAGDGSGSGSSSSN